MAQVCSEEIRIIKSTQADVSTAEVCGSISPLQKHHEVS
jgi:hypothetical protein